VIRSSCVRSVLEVQQSSINFGGCEKGEVRSKTIVIEVGVIDSPSRLIHKGVSLMLW
jgi:hypothetical protein